MIHHNYDICNIDNFPNIKANEEEQNYEHMQYLGTIKMDINPSYGMHTVEN